MRVARCIAWLGVIVLAGAAGAADMLPLHRGIYVPVARPCRSASNAEIVNYWGGRSSIGFAQATCTIARLSRKGNVYTVSEVCRDLQSNQRIEGGPTTLTIANPASFRMNGTNYRYCGPRVQF